MPSLANLQEFKSSFGTIANEAMSLAEWKLPADDLALPANEPIPLPVSEEPPAGEAAEPAGSPDFNVDGGEASSMPGIDDIPLPGTGAADDDDDGIALDFGNFLDTIPDTLTDVPEPPPLEVPPATAAPSAEPSAGFGTDDTDLDLSDIDTDLDLPDTGESGLDLSDIDLPDFDSTDTGFPGLGADVSADTAFPDLSADVSADTAFPDLGADVMADSAFPDLSDDAADDLAFPDLSTDAAVDSAFPDLSADASEDSAAMEGLLSGLADDIEAAVPDGEPAEASAGTGLPEDEMMSLLSEEPGEDAGDLGGLDLGGESLDLGGESLDLGGELPDFGDEISETPAGQTAGGEGFPPDLGAEGLDLGGGDSTADILGGGSDPILNFNFGEETPAAETGEEVSGEGDAAAAPDTGDYDFSLAGVDDVIARSMEGGPGGAPRLTATQGAEDTVEEIQLSDADFEKLRNTLSSYPLNLRVAIEELIAEQAVAPDLMSALIKLLVRGGSAREAASLAGKILGKPVTIPKGFAKKTGEEMEAEQASFRYIFTHKFLPVLRIAFAVAIVAVSSIYLIYEFIYTPLRANSIYQAGYERLSAGEYARANNRFSEAFSLHRDKKWFYRYAEAFRDQRQYIYAEEKYDELLRYYPRDKKGALDYAYMETNYQRNYDKADRIIRNNILDYKVNDIDGLIALGDNNMLWGEIDSGRYEEARRAYALLLEEYGWKDPYIERMLRYFIRTDNLAEVLPLQQYFMGDPRKRQISAVTLAELGGYLLDKRFEESRGVPDEHISQIEGIRDILLRAARAAPALPEAHYHLARYYNRFGNLSEERQTLQAASRTFDAAPEESTRRTAYRLDTQRRYAQILTNDREFFAAEEQLVKGINIYEDAVDRRVLNRDPDFGRLYADLGDLEYFTKSGNMAQALEYYLRSERNGWAPPEIQYRMGAAHYYQRQWAPALERFFTVSSEIPLNRRLLHALGNASYMRGNYFNAQGYFNRLLDLLDAERARFPMLMPNDRPEHLELAERMMTSRNNLAVTLEALTEVSGNANYRSRALGLYTESARAWDSLTRNPESMIRAGAGDLSSPGINLAFLNSRNSLYPVPGFEPQLYMQIDKDVLEPSLWEALVPVDYRLSDVVGQYR